MKKNIYQNAMRLVKSKGVLAVAAGLILASCGAQMGGYTETDGVYYDPNKDTLPQGVIIDGDGNTVGETYQYNSNSVIENSNQNVKEYKQRYNSWDGVPDSDWGVYNGTSTSFNSSYWGSPLGYYAPYGVMIGFMPVFSYGPASFYGYNPYYSSFYSPYYSPYYSYSPYSYYGGGYGSYYDPYYSGYYFSGPAYKYQRSGANGRGYNTAGNPGGLERNANTPKNTGFRTGGSVLRTQGTPQSTVNTQQQPRLRNEQPGYQTQPIKTPTYEQPRTRNYDGGFRSGNDGFRSGGNSMNSNSGSTGATRERSGGFR